MAAPAPASSEIEGHPKLGNDLRDFCQWAENSSAVI